MKRFDGTAARQLELWEEDEVTRVPNPPAEPVRRPALRVLQKDVYAELSRRRRRAQIAARHLLDRV